MLRDLLVYHDHFNRAILELLIAHQDRVDERAHPLFCHILNAQRIWNNRLRGKTSSSPFETFPLENALVVQEENHRTTLSLLGDMDPNAVISYQNTKGQSFQNTAGDILLHVCNHTTHHRAQIVSMLRAADITPPVSDYIFFKRGF